MSELLFFIAVHKPHIKQCVVDLKKKNQLFVSIRASRYSLVECMFPIDSLVKHKIISFISQFVV